MRNQTQLSFTVLLVAAVLTLPTTSVQAGELAVPGTFDLTFLVDFIAEVIDGVQAVVSPSETAGDLPDFGGAIEPVGNESAEPEEGLPDFGGGIEPVG